MKNFHPMRKETRKMERAINRKFIEEGTIGLARRSVQLGNTLFNKVLCENEKCVFYYYLKLNELLGQPNRLAKRQSAAKTQGILKFPSLHNFGASSHLLQPPGQLGVEKRLGNRHLRQSGQSPLSSSLPGSDSNGAMTGGVTEGEVTA